MITGSNMKSEETYLRLFYVTKSRVDLFSILLLIINNLEHLSANRTGSKQGHCNDLTKLNGAIVYSEIVDLK